MIFIGNFVHLTNQEKQNESERRHGEFNLVIEAKTVEMAIDMFKAKITELRQTSNFFEGNCSIFFNELLGIDQFPQKSAMVLNYKSVVGDPLMPFIGCSLPTQENEACEIFDWSKDGSEKGSDRDRLFLEFKS